MDDVFAQAIAESVAEMRALLKSTDPSDKVRAARTLSSMDANYKRVKLLEARTNAYIERCDVLNHRTRSSVSQPKSPPSSSSPPCNSVSSLVKGSAPRKKAFGEPLSPGDIDPRTGRIVPEEHELTLPHLTKETEHIGMCMMPGHKTKADYIRAFHAFYRREDRFHSELRAAKSELNVFRSERLGSITLEKREELLAGRYEKNARRREMYDVPDFVKQFGPETPADVPIPPDPVPDKVARDAEGKPLVPLTRRDREGALDDPHAPSSFIVPTSRDSSPKTRVPSPTSPQDSSPRSAKVDLKPQVILPHRPRAPWHPPTNTDRCNIGDARRDRPP